MNGPRFIVGICLVVFASFAWSHDSRPLYIEINEIKPEYFSIQWKVPPSVPGFNIPQPILPENCRQQGQELALNQANGFFRQRLYHCPGGLAGSEIKIHYPVLNPSLATLFRLKRLSGETHTKVLNPKDRIWQIPKRETRLGVAKDYTVLGIWHIWQGIDHLLFIACLIFVARNMRRILITITGFTLAHSLTLSLSALDIVRVPVAPVEAAIALSIVFMATEIARGNKKSLTYRYPITVSASFGLLHGFGFAAVLREIGLPQTELPTALLFFNLGVEIGQILFVGLMIATYLGGLALIRHWQAVRDNILTLVSRGEVVATYVIGSVAAYWMIDRVSRFWI